jgi:co-chaperonin GroES (HSP10)
MDNTYGTPMKGRVLVKPLPKDQEKTNSPLFIPEESFTTPSRGTVISVADDVDLKEGDIATFSKGIGVPIELDGTDFIILRAEDILLVKRK